MIPKKSKLELKDGTIQTTPGKPIDEIQFKIPWVQENYYEKPPPLGKTLADITRNISIETGQDASYLRFFYAGEYGVERSLSAGLAACDIEVDQRYAVRWWRSSDPLADGCVDCLTIERDREKNQPIDVLSFLLSVSDQWAEQAHDAGQSLPIKKYLNKVYKNTPPNKRTRLMGLIGFPNFDPDDFIGLGFGVLMKQSGTIWFWSRLVFSTK